MLAKASLASSLRTFSLLIASLETARAVAAALMRRRRSAVLFTPPRFLPDPVRAPPWWAMVTLKISRAHVAPLRGSDLIGCALLGSPVGSSTRRRRCHASWRGRNVLKLNIGQKPLNFHGYGWEHRRPAGAGVPPASASSGEGRVDRQPLRISGDIPSPQLFKISRFSGHIFQRSHSFGEIC